MRRIPAARLTAVTATMAVIATAVLVPASASARTADTPSAAADDTAVASTVAPVLKDGKVRRYTPHQMRRVEAQGGDPEVLDFWTPRRMAEAEPLDRPGDRKLVDQRAQAVAAQLAATGEDVAEEVLSHPVPPEGSATTLSGDVEAAARRFPITTGKLFIDGYGSGSWCSASAVNTTSKRVVLTAGHCVHGGPGDTWRNNLVFVPMFRGYADRKAPYGKFQVATMHTFKAWTQDGRWGRDVAFVTTYINAKDKRVVKAVGGQGLRIGGYFAFKASLFGYPSNLAGGRTMQRCDTRVRKASKTPYTSVAFGCRYGQGASGGPWIYRYNGSTGLGYARGVSSFKPANSVRWIGSPHFDKAVKRLRVTANNAF